MEQSTAETFANFSNDPTTFNQIPHRVRDADINFSNNHQFMQSPTDKENNHFFKPSSSRMPNQSKNAYFNAPPREQYQPRNEFYNSPPREQYQPRNDFYNSPPKERYPPNYFNAPRENVQAYSPPIQSYMHRQPFHELNYQNYRKLDDEVFYPSSARPYTTPKFDIPDGRTSRQIKHDVDELQRRVQENERLSRLGFYTTVPSSRIGSYPSAPSSRLSNYPTVPATKIGFHPTAPETRVGFHPTAPASKLDSYPTTSRQSRYSPIVNPEPNCEPIISWKHRGTLEKQPTIRPRSSSHQRPTTEHKIRFEDEKSKKVQDHRRNIVPVRPRASSQQKPSLQTQHKKGKQALLDVIKENYPYLFGFLGPIIQKDSNEMPRHILNALKKRHELLLSSMKRLQESMLLATDKRRDRLIEESNNHKGQQLVCLSLVEQIKSRFFPHGEDKPSSVAAVEDQIRFLYGIFSMNWGPNC